MANEIVFGKNTEIPVELQYALQLIEALFDTERWEGLLHRERRAFDRIKR